MRAWFFILVLLGVLAAAEDSDAPVGLVSYIGDSLEFDTDAEDPRASLPHIEVVDLSEYTACRDQGFPSDCKFEYPIPYVPEGEAEKLERALSEAWARYDARVAHRVDAAIYGTALKCQSAPQDEYLGAWDGTAKELPTEEYCDGDLPSAPVMWYPMVCPSFYLDWEDLLQRYTEAILHGYTNYLVDYYADVGAALARHAPLALQWENGLFPGSGSAIAPVINLDAGSLEQWAELAEKAQDADLRGAAYINQALPGIPRELRKVLRNLPDDERSEDGPGLAQLEALKRTITTRGDIFPEGKPQYWAGKNGGPVPEGVTGAALPEEYQAYGVVPMMRVYTKTDTEVSPHTPTFFVACLTPTTPPVPVPIPIPLPIVHVAPRAHTGWEAVPEGWPIPGIKGDPLY
ncbi:hypothetical protein Ocepr_2352 (plasmid) [Oceanithermus profundus DSM 14977]|uniref:Uncharacterized protein n=1 Tax=Oceanithermus profundus (strain DSM 14977 / NBRC 100410 / VKM B-2274 / 506) TaxID=670487 RepID=E4UAM1_OCEP5|nr:hypothetical protein [Oceanithermus profundus]ADR37800.1 hypothetical protein Ocepr_2352 [Oceanithermus profundus DSM 14977]